MRYLFGAGLAASLLVALPAVGRAQAQRPKAAFTADDVQIGFSAIPDEEEGVDRGGRTAYFKAGFWAPVFVSFTAGPDGVSSGKVAVESTDTDDVQNIYTVALPRGGVGPNEPCHVLAYTKPGSAAPDLTIRLQVDDKVFVVKRDSAAIDEGDPLYLALGSRLPVLRRTLAAASPPGSGRHRAYLGVIDKGISGLPNRWFGYGGVDLVILTTGNREFVQDLINEREHRKEALSEWVRRGGRLILSCAHNQDMIPELLQRLGMNLPLTSTQPLHLDSLDALQLWLPGGTPPFSSVSRQRVSGVEPTPIEVAKLEARPGGELEWMVPARERADSPLLVARVAHGLGQVIVVAFDLDGSAFNAWPGQPEFWKRLQEVTKTRPPSGGDRSFNPAMPHLPGGGLDLATRLHDELEGFPDVAVISFGWVALFILAYIIIVGPLDYWFLKKVVKRLELTWVTFPTIVLVVSAGAYFAAYWLKGNELKINKIDLVDIDTVGRRCYGSSWFTLFSPRIQLYTIGVEPGWTGAENGAQPSSVISWMGRPDVGFGGTGRARSQGIFRRSYDYEGDAEGLRGVPIQVWSTKSFTANWEQPLPPGKPLIRGKLRRRSDNPGIEGSLTNELAATMEDACVVSSEGDTSSSVKVYRLGNMKPGETVSVGGRVAAPPAVLAQWLSSTAPPRITADSDSQKAPPLAGADVLLKHIMFYDFASPEGAQDNALHYLDESWRKGLRNQVMVVGHLQMATGAAEPTNAGPATPSRLWLGELPAAGRLRPPLAGTMAQRVYVRAYLPVEPPAKPLSQD